MKNRIVLMVLVFGLNSFWMHADNRVSEVRDDRAKTVVMTKAEKKLSQTALNEILANHAVLLFQTLNYHWNLTGPEFNDYHTLFDGHYKQLFENMDSIAERVRAVGGFALGSMKEMLKIATLKEDTGATPNPKQMVVNLLKHHEILIEQILQAISLLDKKTKDAGTVNFLQELITHHEKIGWKYRSLTGKE